MARVLARNTFAQSVCCLPNTVWTGDEIDLLVVTPALRVIDVEIKISRADLRADAKKAKWWQYAPWSWDAPGERDPPEKRRWPRGVWKHYYALPEAIWHESLIDAIPTDSGVLLVNAEHHKHGWVTSKRRARANPDFVVLTAEQLVGIARLCTLRMWDALWRQGGKPAERQLHDIRPA